LPEAEISAFNTNPSGLLTDYPGAGLPMSTRVRSLAGSSATTLDSIIALISQAASIQKSAIGAGLARAAKACAAASPQYAQLIQQKVVLAQSAEVTTAFLQATNEVQTASLGGGAGGASGSAAASGLAGGGAATGSSGSSGGESAIDSGAPTYSVAGSGSFNEGDRIVNADVSP